MLYDKLGIAFEVRELAAGERALLEELYLEFLPKRVAQGLPPENPRAITRWLDHILRGGMHLLVRIDGVLRGHLMLIPMEDGVGTELAVFLHQSVRGRGIGTALNRLAVELAREAGFERVWLSVDLSNIAAIRCYRKAGFQMLAHTLWAAEVEMEVRLQAEPVAAST